MSNLVTPDPDQLGIRVTGYTPLAKVVGALRRLYPDAAYADIKALAGQMLRPKPAEEPVQVAEPVAAGPESKPRGRRRAKTEADASLVPVEGGEPIPAEPPPSW